MASEAEQIETCRKACFAASALGYRVKVDEKDGATKYSFRSVLGSTIEGGFYPCKKAALESLCLKFNEQVKHNGK